MPWSPHLIRVVGGLMLAMFVAAIDASVVATALPTIARELGQFSLYPWIFAGYLLTGTTTVPVWGRLADLRGRKGVLLAGLGIFVTSSVLCAASPNMGALIAFRTLQGVGAGCLQPVTLTVVGDLFAFAQRARVQGLFSAMWGVAAVIGPLAGAGFVSTIGWRWIFLINLPAGVVAAALILGLRERFQPRDQGRLGVAGVITLTLGVGLLLWGLGAGGSGASPLWPAVAAGTLLLAAFVLVERRSPSPVVPLHLLAHRVIGPAVLVTFLGGTIMWGVTAYLPLYVQGGMGGSAFAAGAALAPFSFGWPVASVMVGRLLPRIDHRILGAGGGLALVAGTLMLALPAPLRPFVWVCLASLVVGFGMGLLVTPLLIVIQSSVGWGERGAATALNQFLRTIGGAIGVSLMGVLLAQRVRSAAAVGPPALAQAAANPLQAGAGQPAAGALVAAGVEAVFWVLVGLAVVTLCTAVAILVASRSRAQT